MWILSTLSPNLPSLAFLEHTQTGPWRHFRVTSHPASDVTSGVQDVARSQRETSLRVTVVQISTNNDDVVRLCLPLIEVKVWWDLFIEHWLVSPSKPDVVNMKVLAVNSSVWFDWFYICFIDCRDAGELSSQWKMSAFSVLWSVSVWQI